MNGVEEREARRHQGAASGWCEERGGGLDKTLIEIEQAPHAGAGVRLVRNLDAVILFGPRPFNEMSKADKMRACFFHCVLRWLTRDYMSNASLRERFSLADRTTRRPRPSSPSRSRRAASRRRIPRRSAQCAVRAVLGGNDIS